MNYNLLLNTRVIKMGG